MILMIVGTRSKPIIATDGGISAMVKQERKDQAYTLLMIGGITLVIHLILWLVGG
jgi:Fe-S cluster biogenesis protein NfuA